MKPILTCAAFWMCLAGHTVAQSFAIDWHVIAPGGGRATGGGFELNGTIAQPAVGSASGGGYGLEGGFWPGAVPGGMLCSLAITQLPADVTVFAGQAATFQVIATGAPAPSLYQWQEDRGDNFGFRDVPGANDPIYTRTVGNTDTFLHVRCVVGNGCTNVVSAAAIVTLLVGPRLEIALDLARSDVLRVAVPLSAQGMRLQFTSALGDFTQWHDVTNPPIVTATHLYWDLPRTNAWTGGPNTNGFLRLAPPSTALSAAANEFVRVSNSAGSVSGNFADSGTFRNVGAERPVEHSLWPPGGVARANGILLAFNFSNVGDCPILVTVLGVTARKIVIEPGATVTGTEPAARHVTVVSGPVGGGACKVEYGFHW